MALTPEDVVNKRFQSTKFREGYDQDEVDDFLDEIVVELRRLNQENDELRQRLVAADARLAEGQRSAASAPAPASAPAVASAPAAPEPAVASAPAPEPVAAAPATDYSSQADIESTNTANLLQLARRLHEEHVREGLAKRDQLIAEGQATAERLVSEAEATAERLVTEAEGQQRAAVEALASEKATLEQQVDQLRTFEREYREQLRSYIEGQLADLNSSAEVAPAAGDPDSSPAPASAPAWGDQNDNGYGQPASAPAFGQPGSAPSFGQPGSAPGSAPVYPGQQNPQYPGYGN